jgi:hypothetical protein
LPKKHGSNWQLAAITFLNSRQLVIPNRGPHGTQTN